MPLQVHKHSTHLQVDGSPFHFAGFNNYYMPTYAADQNLNERTQDVDVVFAWVSVEQHPPAPCAHILNLVGAWLAWIHNQTVSQSVKGPEG